MTDPGEREVPEVAPDDELASALVDGEATADEQARAADPALAPIVAAFRDVADRVGAPVEPVDPARRDAAIAAALGAFDAGTVGDAAAPAVDLSRHRAARRAVPEWLTAVAAALVVLAGLGLLAGLAASGDDDDSSETAAVGESADTTAAGEAFSEVGDAAGGSGAGSGADEEMATTAALTYLGDFEDVDSLVAAASRNFSARVAAQEDAADTGLSTTTAAGAPTAPAVPPIPCGEEIGPIDPSTVVGTATVERQPASVVLELEDDGDQSIVVYAEPDCEGDRHPFEP